MTFFIYFNYDIFETLNHHHIIMIKKILIANRGEIAVRVIRSAQKMGIKTVAVYSDADKNSLHVKMADEKVHIGASPATESYLQQQKIIDAALQTGADAIHPGYGFLSENMDFARQCEENNIIFIGPSTHAIATMGDKITARNTMMAAGVSVVPGYQGAQTDDETLLKEANKIGYPVMVKATAGGGGKGMRLVHKEEDLIPAVNAARSEAQASFGNGTVYLEKYITSPHHIEIQILADNYGNVIHLNERECSVQRRHQKVVEETPSPLITDEVRQKMGEQAKQAAQAVNYSGAGTVEFLVDDDLNYYFLEMNTRLQVEHPITEMTTGVDLVEEQIRIASGERLRYIQEEIGQNGHAIECRIYAEDPENDFMPASGKIVYLQEPKGEGVRIDGFIDGESEISIYYDPMIAKLIVWDENRPKAIEKMKRALKDYKIVGVKQNIAYLHKILEHPAFVEGKYDTRFVGLYQDDLQLDTHKELDFVAAAIYYKYHQLLEYNMQKVFPDYHLIDQELNIEIAGNSYEVKVVERQLHKLKMQINDRIHYYDIRQENDVLYHLTNEQEEYDMLIFQTGTDDFIVNYELDNYEVKVTHKAGRYAQIRNRGKDADAGNIISTPIPGKVVKIPVSEGDVVEDDTTVIVVEAMKMQSEYKTAGKKRVKEIRVNEGDAIEGDQVLIVLEDVE